MRVTVGEKQFKLIFGHKLPGALGIPGGGATLCVLLEEGEDGGAIKAPRVGEAHCHVADPFVKRTGRRIALTRALAAAELTREERREVWTQYLAKTRSVPGGAGR